MKLTEDQARQKLCPMQPGRPCAASECMLWRWNHGRSPEEIEARKEWNVNPQEPLGFCGLSN